MDLSRPWLYGRKVMEFLTHELRSMCHSAILSRFGHLYSKVVGNIRMNQAQPSRLRSEKKILTCAAIFGGHKALASRCRANAHRGRHGTEVGAGVVAREP